MPIYEYVCEKCGSHIEVMQKISDPPLKRCQKCRGKLGKVVSRTSFQLKGGGWYASDYSRKASNVDKNVDKTDKSADKKTESVPSSDAK
jgi:putative FmdB family regulatory protein